MGILESKDQFKIAFKRRIKKYRIERLDEEVYLRPLSAAVRATLADAFSQSDGMPILAAAKAMQWQAVACGLVTESGDRLFSDNELEEIGKMDADIIDELSTEILHMSGLGETSTKLGDTIKNSVGAPSADSPSSSDVPTAS